MELTPHETSDDRSGAWSVFAQVLSILMAIFATVSGIAFILGGYKHSRAHGPAPAAPAAASAPGAAAPAAAGTPAGPVPAAIVAVTGNEVTLKPGTDNPLTYDIKGFTVKAGQKLKVTFNNQSALPQPHNFILGTIGSKDRLTSAVMAMAGDPNGFAKSYIPDSPDILAKMNLVNAGQTGSIEFTVPAEKGDYPYLCSFPGHALLMNGVMKVE